jgi:hypothetical protein
MAAPLTLAAGARAATVVEAVVAAAERVAGGTAVRLMTAGGGTSTADLSQTFLVPPVLNAGLSGPSPSGPQPAGRAGFGSGTSPTERGVTSRRSGSDQRPTPSDPRRPLSGLAGGGGNGGTSGSGGNGTPVAALLDPATAPAVSTLGAVTTAERRITWWYPEIVVSPG